MTLDKRHDIEAPFKSIVPVPDAQRCGASAGVTNDVVYDVLVLRARGSPASRSGLH